MRSPVYQSRQETVRIAVATVGRADMTDTIGEELLAFGEEVNKGNSQVLSLVGTREML